MAFKWVNPGYGELFDTSTVGTITTTSTYSKFGLYVDTGTAIQSFPATKEVWIRVDISTSYWGSGTVARMYIDNDADSRTGLFITNSDNVTLQLLLSSTEIAAEIKQLGLSTGKIYKFVLHIKSDASNGVIEVSKDGVCIAKYSGNVYNGRNINKFITKNDSYIRASHFIVADYDISNEEIAIVPLKDITGTWEGISEGTTKATEAGQTLSHKIDSTKLKEYMSKYSTDPTITSITVGAKGIQYDSDKVNKLKVDITNGTTSLLSESLTIASDNTLPLKNVIKNISTDVLDNITFTLTSEKV